MSEKLLTYDELAERLGLTKKWLMARVVAGEIPFARFGRNVRFTEEHVQQIIASAEQSAALAPPVKRRHRRAL